ncbi:DUF805 domain-containing protein [Listeria valentina]|uniref:DUF805 domain-containing protein n=1 Tax=Listeria valentina TaxID=2705293 RepID=UPI001431D164|nr:DUF805 domain-containing protein [Listeria valentina]
MGFLEAYKSFWRNYANFSGRASRSEYWFATLWNGIITMAYYIITLVFGLSTALAFASTGGSEASNLVALGPILFIGLIFWLYAIAIIVPSVSLLVRRIRDTGRSPWMIFLGFIPLVGPIILFVFTLLPSEYADFDADPYGY